MSPRWKKILLFILLPALAGILAVRMVIPAPEDSGNIAWWDATISVTIFTIEALILSNILKFYRPAGGREWTLAVWIVVLCAGWLFSTLALLNLVAGNHEAYGDFLIAGLYLRFFMALIVLTCVALVTWVRRQSESEKKSQERMSEIRQMSRDAELHTLRQQLQPHFLFNSLNSIQTLISHEPKRAKEMVVQLSDYLRSTLRKGGHSRHTVDEEIENARLYLDIERVRFGDRLQIFRNVEESCKGLSTPSMVLQPLLENAVKYGIYQTIGPVEITLSAHCSPGMVIFTVVNPKGDGTTTATGGAGFGLESLRRRMFLIYGRNDLLETEETEHLFKVNLKIPQS